MVRWIEGKSDVALRKIDIVKWESEAAKQLNGDYGVDGIPYVRVYGRDGKFLGDVRGADFERVKALAK